MAGPWERYAPQPATSAAPPGPWTKYAGGAPAAPAEATDSLGSIGENAVGGLNRAIFNTLGAPVDAATWLTNKGVQGVEALTGYDLPEARDVPGGSASIARAFEHVGVADPDTIEADTVAEKLARGMGEGVGYAVAPEAAIAGLTRAAAPLAPRVMDAAGRMFGRAESAGAVGGNMVAGAASGIGASAAGQAVPEEWRSIAEMGGGLVGGGVGTLAAGVPSLAQAGARMAGDYLAPLTQGGRERLAGETLLGNAADRGAFREALDEGGEQLVPGSAPTTFQATGDMGIGRLERSVAARNPQDFMTRRADQNSARLDALGGVQREGAPDAVSQALRARLSAIDEETNTALRGATEAAQSRTAALGGGGTPEGYGESLRGSLTRAEEGARAQERALWAAVDPDGSLALRTGNLRDAALGIAREQPNAARPMEGEERAAFLAAARFGDVMPFSEVTALRSRVSAAMREELFERGQTPAYARLSRLRGAIERNIEGAVTQRVEQEAQAVASGAMREEDTAFSRLLRESNAWQANREATRATGEVGGTGYSGGSPSAERSAPLPGIRGAEREAGRGFSDPSGYSGLPGDAGLTPNFDEAALGRLRTANEATRQRAETYKAAPVGQLLRRSGQSGPFNVPNAVVPERIFTPGAKGFDSVQAYRRAAGDDEAFAVLQDYAASQLRRLAEVDGVLDPRRMEGWRRRHADALRAFPELDARLADASRASEMMAEAAATRRAALDDYQAGIVGRVIGVTDPADVTRTIGRVFGASDAVAQMRRLVAETRTDPAAREGLRKAVVDHMTQRLVSNTEAATSGRELLKSDVFQQFVRDNRAALRIVFSERELASLEAIAADLQRANRSIAAVKLPGGSNTTQDVTAVLRDEGQPGILIRALIASAASGGTGALLGGPIAGLGALLGGGAVSALRQAGLSKMQDLIRDAMLNPDVARVLIAKVPVQPDKGATMTLAQRYRRIAATIPALMQIGREEEEAKR